MKDELKLYTEQNRESFELNTLDLDDAWKGIEDRLNENDQKSIHFPWRKLLKVAAGLILIAMLGAGYYLNNLQIQFNENGIALHNVSSELADTEAFYATQIAAKIKLIGVMEPEVQHEIELLDEEYQSLKNDLRDNADSEEVINAMIENYRLKLQMLEKILEEIQKNDENNEYEEVQAI